MFEAAERPAGLLGLRLYPAGPDLHGAQSPLLDEAIIDACLVSTVPVVFAPRDPTTQRHEPRVVEVVR